MAETFSKKEKREKKAKKKQEKAHKMEERKVNNSKGKGLEGMMAYLDENGNLTSVRPPADRRMKEVEVHDIQLGAAPVEAVDVRKKGIVSFYSEKGYGFITEEKSREKIFVHNSELSQPVREGDKVTFEIGKTDRGLNAFRVEKE
jgi:CspA family cold shock protein